ncbi:hypothetical protein BBJ28_00025286 [Nothophytophthora sp. Chile5]|nr:hypothetical protein BBJ28_00025286 [Nothophytophthora sp. Chile5]
MPGIPSSPSTAASPGNDAEVLDVDNEGLRLLTVANRAAVPSSSHRKLLVLLLLLVVAGMATVTFMASYLDAGSSGTSSFDSIDVRTNNLLIHAFSTNAIVLEDEGFVFPYLDLPIYQRGEWFDKNVSRERGVLLCMHDGVLAMGLSLIRELRCLGNEELVQVYHCGPNELSIESRDMLFGADNRLELVDVCTDLVARGVISKGLASKFRNWWIKPLAMYHTDVRHVMLMDVDDIVIKDPAALRDLEQATTVPRFGAAAASSLKRTWRLELEPLWLEFMPYKRSDHQTSIPSDWPTQEPTLPKYQQESYTTFFTFFMLGGSIHPYSLLVKLCNLLASKLTLARQSSILTSQARPEQSTRFVRLAVLQRSNDTCHNAQEVKASTQQVTGK